MWKALINLVNKWAYRCDHKYVAVNKSAVYKYDGDKYPAYHTHTYVCEKCCKNMVVRTDGK